MIRINDTISLGDREIEQRFVRAAGSRGQNATHDGTAVELRFNIGASSLPLDVRERLAALAGRHVTADGILVMISRASRSQSVNRKSAWARIVALIKRAAEQPVNRYEA